MPILLSAFLVAAPSDVDDPSRNTYLYYERSAVPLTVRLSPRTERALNALARRRRMSRSDVVREALSRYEADEGSGKATGRPYDAWLDVIGVVNLGVRDPARTTGEQFSAMLRQQARTRRAR